LIYKFNIMKIKFRIICLVLLISISIFTVATPVAKAEVWGTNVLSATLKQMMEKIVEQIRSAIVAALKQAAIQVVNETVNNLISGGGSEGAMFITDWRETLIEDPKKEAQAEINSYVNQMLRGRGSVSNYFSGAEGVIGGFTSNLQNTAGSMFTDYLPKMGILEYTNDPTTDLFQDGSLRALGELYQNPQDSLPAAISLNVEAKALQIYNEKQSIAATQAIAYGGYKGQGGDSSVVTPGSLIKDIQADAANLGNLSLANAQNFSEVIVSMVTKVVTSTIKQGVGNAKRNIQKEINNTTGTWQTQFNQNNPVDRFKPAY